MPLCFTIYIFKMWIYVAPGTKQAKIWRRQISEGDFFWEHVTTPFFSFPPLQMSKLLLRHHVSRNVQTKYKLISNKQHGYNTLHVQCAMIKLTSGSISSEVLYKGGSETGAGRTILPSPEDSPTIPGLFSKVWEDEPTWRQHYRPSVAAWQKRKKVTNSLDV